MNGHFDVLQWCRENGCPWDERTCMIAAQYGDLSILQWCRENGCPWNAEICTETAATNLHWHIVEWCVDNGFPMGRDIYRDSLLEYAADMAEADLEENLNEIQ